MYHTIGQRKGLGIGEMAKLGLLWKRFGKNNLLVCQGSDNENLFSNRLLASGFVSSNKNFEKKILSVRQNSRYRQKDIEVKVKFLDDDHLEIIYDHIKSVTPGQAAVFRWRSLFRICDNR